MTSEPVTVNKIIIESTMNYKDTPVLHYRIEYPRFQHQDFQNQLDPINEWYRYQAEELQRKYETELYQEAAAQYDYSVENQFPFHMYDALMIYEITYNQDDFLSLFYDQYIYSGGAHGNTVRRSQTWNVKRGCLITLRNYTDEPAAFQAEIINRIREEIVRQIERGENMYFDDYPKLILDTFNPESFYLTPHGMVIYYQQYDIAPYASGIPVFVIQF